MRVADLGTKLDRAGAASALTTSYLFGTVFHAGLASGVLVECELTLAGDSTVTKFTVKMQTSNTGGSAAAEWEDAPSVAGDTALVAIDQDLTAPAVGTSRRCSLTTTALRGAKFCRLGVKVDQAPKDTDRIVATVQAALG